MRGAVCVQGSHKARHPMPLPPGTSIDMDCVRQVSHNRNARPSQLSEKTWLANRPILVPPGSLVFFHGSTTAHGSRSWQLRERGRRSILQFYQPGGRAWDFMPWATRVQRAEAARL